MPTSVPEHATQRTTNADREVFEHNLEQVFEMGRQIGLEEGRREVSCRRLLVSCEEAGRMLGVKPWPVVELCRAGELAHSYIGEQIVIPVQAVFDYAAKVSA